jgi:hypothetical protein
LSTQEIYLPGQPLPRRRRSARTAIMPRVFNISTFKVGGIRFIKLGRINVAISVSREYRA